MDLCQCGCGTELPFQKYYKRSYINGHQRIGKKHKEETKTKISKTKLDKTVISIDIESLTFCLCGCGQKVTKLGNKYIQYHNNRGRKYSEETRLKMSKAQQGHSVSEEQRKHHSEVMKGRPAWNKGIPNSEIHNERVRIARSKQVSSGMKGRHHTDEAREKIRKARAEQVITDETRQKLSKAQKNLWADPEFARKRGIAYRLKPNKPESFLISLLAELYPNQWQYTGDFSYWINGKNPDFVNFNTKQVIEYWGSYFHREHDPEARKEIFFKEGYETLIIYESELKNLDEAIYKIKKFVEP